MTSAPGTPILALAVTTAEAAAILADNTLRTAWERQPAAFAVIGIDRLTGSAPAATDLDPSLLATALATYGGPPVLFAAAAHIDLPYNLARRALSLDHLTRGRSGILLGSRDTRGRTGDAWSGAGLGSSAEIGPETTADTARALIGLWQSWPRDSIIGDKDSGILVRSERIRRVDHRGVTRTAGPLSIPASAQGTPVLARYITGPESEISRTDTGDLTVLGGFPDRGSVAAALEHRTTPLVTESADIDTADVLLTAGAHGILLRTGIGGSPAETATDLLRTAAAFVADRGGPGALDSDATLRNVLGLAPPADLLADAPPAFAVPSPAVYR
ncbi:hypothetical protein [Nocardia carnea]|uniref:hypothetical protein n=1 Tax=Nocardia carnea TaxID=37328 RepID=UPI0024579428|nr:hypothetical protein [Nocardia carnea]